jgi:Ca2+-binding RTX toxin-like protein
MSWPTLRRYSLLVTTGVDAGGGDDYVNGFNGDDELHGGDGDDYVVGDQWSDEVQGGFGDDELYGDRRFSCHPWNQGDDVIDGDSGDDLVVGGGASTGSKEVPEKTGSRLGRTMMPFVFGNPGVQTSSRATRKAMILMRSTETQT